MAIVAPGDYGWVEGYGNVNAYNSEAEAAASGDAHVLIPSENLDSSIWSTMDSNGTAGVVVPAVGYGAIIPIRSSMLQGADIQHLQKYYDDSYYEATGQHPPGVVPVWVIILIIIIIISAMLVLAGLVFLCHLIDASTGSSTTNWTDPTTGDSWVKSCSSSFLGGTACVLCDTTTNKCQKGENTGGATDTIVQIAEYALIIGAVSIGGYLLYRAISGHHFNVQQSNAYKQTVGFLKKEV